MNARFALFSVICGLLVAPLFVFAAPVINEVFFNPSAGSDSGLEKIEIYNPDAISHDMSGWELYPDGIGYFAFPVGFSLAAKSFTVVHLRASGANDAANLYHFAPSNNMGNTSGSAALFNSSNHTKASLIDFVEWSVAGASSTWESYAADKGLWQKGTPMNTASLQAGSSIGLITDGLRASASSWKIYSLPSLGTANAALSGGESGDSASTSPSGGEASGQQKSESASAPPPVPALGAEAGADALVVAGSIVQFRGLAFGLDGELLPSARFLWNFGDGVVQEGKSRTHVYYFPGTYRAGLFVSSGEYTGSDWRTITVVPPEIAISEAKPGDDGFTELFNASPELLDIGGMSLTDDVNAVFRVPSGTMIGSNGAIVFPNAVTGLNPRSALTLRDARGGVLDAGVFSDALPVGASWERSGAIFAAQTIPTPGKAALRSVLPPPASDNPAGPLPVYSVRTPPVPAGGNFGNSPTGVNVSGGQSRRAGSNGVSRIVQTRPDSGERGLAFESASGASTTFSDTPESASGAGLAAAFSAKMLFSAAAVIFSFLGVAAFLIVKRTAA